MPKTIQPAAGAAVYFDGCHSGITVNHSSADIYNTEMDNVRTGIKVENGSPFMTVNISNNEINCFKFGVHSELTDMATSIDISYPSGQPI